LEICTQARHLRQRQQQQQQQLLQQQTSSGTSTARRAAAPRAHLCQLLVYKKWDKAIGGIACRQVWHREKQRQLREERREGWQRAYEDKRGAYWE